MLKAKKQRLWGVVWGAAAWAGGGIAVAAAAPSAADIKAADSLFELAKQQLARGEWRAACDNFQASMRLDPSVSTQVKIARCHEHDGAWLQSWSAYQRARELTRTLQLSAARRQALDATIQDALRALEPRLARLDIRPLPSAARATVSVHGQPATFDSNDGVWVVQAGRVEVIAHAPGFQRFQLAVEALSGQRQRVELNLQSAPPPDARPTLGAAVPGAASASASSRPQSSPASTRRTPEPSDSSTPPQTRSESAAVSAEPDRRGGSTVVPLVIGAAGVTALGVAAYFGVKTLWLVNHADCDSNYECSRAGVESINDASRAQKAAFIAGGVGAALLGTSVIWVVTRPKPGHSLSARVSPFSFAVSGQF